MARPGRKPASALSVASLAAPVAHSTERLQPPAHIPDAEREVWLSVVNDQPAGAFTITHAPLMEIYCRHVIQSRILADEILNFDRSWLADDDGLKRYDTLLKMHDRENRAASSAATRLRITRQSIDQQTIARAMVNEPKSRKPWEIGE